MRLKNQLFMLALVILFKPNNVLAANNLEGNYQTLKPERGKYGAPTHTVYFQQGELNQRPVLTVSACLNGCIPTLYTYDVAISDKVNIPIYYSRTNTYLLHYGERSWILASPSSHLSGKPWKGIKRLNIFTQEGSNFPLTEEEAANFVMSHSRDLGY
ncbi:hypothetical protein [Alteromonas sp. a30]|uniref:hypothetical protein n=1 Tax=Alteromonas sp. a30 TaxID=2730917 RepID=UPI00227F72EB|nr:hypothetical protein [Alteromonas sp. a30]MCY7297278.1 hypothetical protein [Alteromonas sp. a30]